MSSPSFAQSVAGDANEIREEKMAADFTRSFGSRATDRAKEGLLLVYSSVPITTFRFCQFKECFLTILWSVAIQIGNTAEIICKPCISCRYTWCSETFVLIKALLLYLKIMSSGWIVEPVRVNGQDCSLVWYITKVCCFEVFWTRTKLPLNWRKLENTSWRR